MKYTIEGFSQEYLMSLKYNEIAPTGKTKQVVIKIEDIILLRYFVDNYKNLHKVTIDSFDYYILSYSKILNDLPLLKMSKKSLSVHFKKLCNMNLLKMILIENNVTAFGFGPVLIDLLQYAEDRKFYNFASTTTKMHQAAYDNFLDKVLNRDLPELSQKLLEMSYKDFLNTLYWKCITKYIKDTTHKCSRCSNTKLLHVHHKTYENHGFEHHIHVMNNDLEVLCSKCHKQEHHLEA